MVEDSAKKCRADSKKGIPNGNKKQWHEFESSPHEEFGAYLKWCISMVGGREESAKGHFRNAGVIIEELGSCTTLR
jgi:hypothetical protein